MSIGPFPLDWANLQNPILSLPDRMLKDQCVVLHNGYFYIFASMRRDGDDQLPGIVFKTRDFKSYKQISLQDTGSSPDVTFYEGHWIRLTQSPGDSAVRTIYGQTSADLEHWSVPFKVIPRSIQYGLRKIDGVLAREGTTWHLGYKGGQTFWVIHTDGTLQDGPWRGPDPVDAAGEWAENYQWIKLDGRWRMIATARAPADYRTGGNSYTGDHQPFIYTMIGDGSQDVHWTRWGDKRHLVVPQESWNTVMHANSAFLCDWRAFDGHFYLFYAGANDDRSFDGRGHGRIGMARSRDLITWNVPGS